MSKRNDTAQRTPKDSRFSAMLRSNGSLAQTAQRAIAFLSAAFLIRQMFIVLRKNANNFSRNTVEPII